MIRVSEPFLPPLDEYKQMINRIWENHALTNQGPLLKELEQTLKNYLKVAHFHFLTNGTIALQVALNALHITEGEIITTPFSYVASISSILWERCKPIFVDIDPKTLCIDPTSIEAAITNNTKAIMATHIFGYPCDTDTIQEIANKYDLKIIYDGAHAFGSQYQGQSLLNFGDITTCSFHATKLFHTVEGGACIVKNKKISDRLEYIKRFGCDGDQHYLLGINAKNSEFHAAMGLCNFKYLESIIEERKQLSTLYDTLLNGSLLRPTVLENLNYNYAYYPVIFENEAYLLNTMKRLNEENIFPRRYFYPSLNTLPYLSLAQICPISESISTRILCLPLYNGLKTDEVEKIVKIMKG